jgi:hypothetical protein
MPATVRVVFFTGGSTPPGAVLVPRPYGAGCGPRTSRPGKAPVASPSA